MSNPYEQQTPGQQPADSEPTQFAPLGGQQPQPGYGQPPQFGQEAPQQPQFGQAPPFGQQPQQPQDAFGQQPQFGQAPPFGQQPQFGQAPQFGQQPADGSAPGWGQGAQQQPTMPYAYTGTPMPQAKQKRAGGAAAFFLRSAVGRLVIFAVIAGGVALYHYATSDPAQRSSSGQVSQAGSMQASDLKVGDCFDNPSANSNISSITAIPCTQAHDSQVFAEPPVKESSYPGDSTLASEAQSDCNDQSTQSTIAQDAPSSLEVNALYAQDEQSFDNGNNYVTCFLISSSRNLTQSYVDAN